MTFEHENFFYIESKENGYAIVDHASGEHVYFTEKYRKALSRLNRLNKRR